MKALSLWQLQSTVWKQHDCTIFRNFPENGNRHSKQFLFCQWRESYSYHTTAVPVPISILYYSFRNAMHVHCIFYPCSLLLFVVVLHGRLTFWRKFKLLFFVCAAVVAVALRRKMYLTLFFISLAWADERSLPPWACDLVIILLAMTPATAD